jgi:hypothetical protein
MNQEENKCTFCCNSCDKESMKSVPRFFVPGAHFIYGCDRYVKKGMYLGSWKFLIGPILVDFEVRGTMPICPKCRRVVLLSSIALYLLILGGLLGAILTRTGINT